MNIVLAPASLIGGLIGGLVGWPFKEAAKIGLAAVGGWVVAGAEAMLHEVVALIGLVSTPSLTASWFSPTYWRITGLALVLTLPFLFAAAVQAVVRADLGVLTRAAFVHLPIAVLAASVTAPMMQLALAATDQLCLWITAGGGADAGFLDHTAVVMNSLGTGVMAVVIAVVILLAGFVLLIELIMRAAAIYIVVLFLPLGFAAMVWPARRIWLTRMLETLAALVISKFVMVAILAVAVDGVATFVSGAGSLTTALTATALLVLSAFSPWVLLRLLPFTEIAAATAGPMGQELRALHRRAREQFAPAESAPDPADDAERRASSRPDGLEHLLRSFGSDSAPTGSRSTSRPSSAASILASVTSGPDDAPGDGGDGHARGPEAPGPGPTPGPGGARDGGATFTGPGSTDDHTLASDPGWSSPSPDPRGASSASSPPSIPEASPVRPTLEEEMPLLDPANAEVVLDLAVTRGGSWLLGPGGEPARLGQHGQPDAGLPGDGLSGEGLSGGGEELGHDD